ncbi:MAG: hypothetical protein M1839_002023 [Geoglossum umbratile]|nr:MAG: hypothetical protein M1839_002023 [Geoglossum umbratile]
MEVSSFRSRYDQIRDLDRMRDKLVEDLLTTIERLKVRETELVSAMDRNSFVSVLIDGSGIILRENFLRQGREGGKEAARKFSDSIRDHIRQHIPNLSHILRITARIYVNVSELSRVLGRGDEAGNRETVAAFVQGFTNTQLLFDFIDIETEEQGAEKMKGKKLTESLAVAVANHGNAGSEAYNLHIYDYHCKHVILGFSANSHSHNALVRLYNDSNEISNRTTIIMGSANECDSSGLTAKFKTTTFPWLFRPATTKPGNNNNSSNSGGVSIARGQQSPARLNLYSPTSPTSPTPSSSTLTLLDSPISTAPNSSARDTPNPPEFTKQFFTPPPILLNWKGQRLDPALSAPEHTILALKLRNPKLCNSFYLRGRCTSRDCQRDHAHSPTVGEIDALRTLARQSPCRYTDRCTEEWCFFGHNCPWNCVRESCKFREVHGIDMRTVEPLLAIEG